MADLQKDPMTRSQFLMMGGLGGLVGLVLTVPPAVFILSPTIQTSVQGESDVPDVWRELGSVFEVPQGEIQTLRIQFPQNQTYQQSGAGGNIENAIMVSWHDGNIPDIVKNKNSGASFSQDEVNQLNQKLNVLSNSCAHLGCPVRWFPEKHQILCPCHGGVYNINGGYEGGPPPRGLYHYVFQVRKDGVIRVKHRFKNGKPYVY